jgi:hypothetical protein
MMATLTKIPLSASTHGRGVLVAATAIGSGTTIHTAQATTTDGLGDEIVLYAYNSNSTAEVLVMGIGGTTDPDDLQKFSIPAGSTVQIMAGLLLRNALVLKAASTTTNKVTVHGYVLRAS